MMSINVMHAKPGLRVFLKWMIARSGSVITDVIYLGHSILIQNMLDEETVRYIWRHYPELIDKVTHLSGINWRANRLNRIIQRDDSELSWFGKRRKKQAAQKIERLMKLGDEIQTSRRAEFAELVIKKYGKNIEIPECPECDGTLRTPVAKVCVVCGANIDR